MEDEFGIGVGVGSVTETVTRGLKQLLQQPFRSSQFFCGVGEREGLTSLGGWTVECRIALSGGVL